MFDIPEDDLKKVGTKAAEQQLNFSYGDLATEIDPEFKLDDNSREQFVEGYKKRLEEAKTTVDFDLSAFSDDQKEFIKFFQGGGKAQDLYDPMIQYNNWLGQSADEKITDYLVKEKQFSEEEVPDEMERMRQEGSFDETLKKLNGRVLKARDEEYEKLIKNTNAEYDSRSQRRQESDKVATGEVVKAINEMENFMGFKINENTKKHLLLEVKTGRFGEAAKTPQAQLSGRMYSLFGSKLLEKIQEAKKEDNRKGYNAGKEETQKNLHHIKTKQVSPTGVNEGKEFVKDDDDPLGAFIEAAEEVITDEF